MYWPGLKHLLMLLMLPVVVPVNSRPMLAIVDHVLARLKASVDVTCGGVAMSPDVQNSRPRVVIIVDHVLPRLHCQGHLLMLGQYTSICLLFCTSGDVLVPPQVTLSSSKLTGLS